ncbi:3-deoxy-D-manno-octulosonate 8-phosphate phosphatase [Haemophilus paracuniculus]|uniref:3-deoxy-D-manno-octulosonate 8-phosphate phosphatase KdsC n=1 Tax=Haemophilus paracuniculus TaxID=734 RepID=A0A1T0ATL1_9PAST|nr:HAD-IIIA family hydrolase [Haemophilus paracuniculus]OOR99884.1 3-deoxy-D-manno-octulosonate 8-phosphate phosphatase [Haemophilus paracuniculus]
MEQLLAKLSKIKLVITDVDGVLTDGSLYYTDQGETMKRFNVRDGLGTKMLQAAGIQVAVLSGGDKPFLRKRLDDLGITLSQLGKMEKRTACFELMEKAGVTAEQTVYLGDDSLDLPAFEVCGVAVAVGDAFSYIKEKADFVLETAGGHGALRELSDLILTAQNKQEMFNSADGFLKIVSQMKIAQ